MPFMIGRAPIRRTLKYLESGELHLKSRIQIFTVNYNIQGDHHQGARDFVFWKIPQVQYKNPDVQIITFKNMTPTPFIRLFYDDGKEMVVDIDGRTKEEIMNHLLKVAGKTREEAEQSAMSQQRSDNPANFGYGCSKSCICTIMGQVPCPSTVPVPYEMRGKYTWNKKEEL